MNCPICNKSGLPDYRKHQVVCPQCNSDLRGYSTLEKVNRSLKKELIKQHSFYISVIVIIVVVSLLLLFYQSNYKATPEITNNYKDSLIKVLESKNSKYFQKLNEIQSLNLRENKEYINYIVKEGDNLSKIAYFFYNNALSYRVIEKVNNLHPNCTIYPGDTLIIKLNF
jgi:uncharacterized membrane protein YvbJ